MTADDPISAQPDDDRAEWLSDQLIAYNRAHSTALPTAAQPAEPLQLYLTGPDGEVLGGLIGRTNTIASWLEVSVLWVADAERGRGQGRRLMARAEEIGRSRGCRYARLSTSNYQAPEFYPHLGYELYGTLTDCPPGETAYFFRKDLG